MSARRLAALCASLLALALLTAPATAAAAGHPLLFSFYANSEQEGPHFPPRRPYPPPGDGFEDACGVALDSHADIYVADYYNDNVDVFSPSPDREYQVQIASEDPVNGPCALAVDSQGDLYVDNWRQDVLRYTPSSYPPTELTTYGPATVIDSGPSTGVAVDPATGDVYVDDGTYVAEYEPTGHPVEVAGHPVQIGLGTLGKGYGVAVSDFPASEGDVYVPDASTGTVRIYDSAGNPAGAIDGAGTPQSGFHDLLDSSVAVAPTDGHLYVADNLDAPFEKPAALIDEFNPAGEYRGQLPHAFVDPGPPGLAVDRGGDIYVTSGNTETSVLYGFGPTAPAHTLEVSRTGPGTGAITSQPAGIECGSACGAEYEVGEALTLTATPGPHSAFAGWSGGGCSGTGPCHLTLGADTAVSAEFEAPPQQTLKLETIGSGFGSVTSSPAGIECGATCTAEFNQGSEVTLTAHSGPTSRFLGWSGGGCAGTGPCEVTLSALTEVGAAFEAIAQPTLSVEAVGAGTVSSEPAGIYCGETCEHAFNDGTQVTLSASPVPGFAFTGWSGGGCAGTGSCEVTLGGDIAIRATFAAVQHTLAVTRTGNGAGTVTGSPAGIECGASCEHAFDDGVEVTLAATPAPGSRFTGWSGGGCAGAGACLMTISEDTEVSARFQLTRTTLAFSIPGLATPRGHRHRHRHHRRHGHRKRGRGR